MPPGKRFARPLTQQLAAFPRSIGRDPSVQLRGISCAPQMSAENGAAPFSHIWRYLR